LLIRYRRSPDGKPVAKALVYTQKEHHIEKSRLDPDAVRIVERLRENGHEAYIVGGAVRDLLLGRRPKDFDIVTDAQPSRIKHVFRNARVIGRRFRLVHVYAGPKIFEVSTFRSIANGTVGNEFGTMDEDAFRRDFSLNALYYDPIEELLVDYVGGFKDIAARRIKPVIDLKSIFKEDPVRMIRCVKYASTTGFHIPFQTRRAIRRDSALLAGASPSRLTEEFVKILGSGASRTIVSSLADFDLLRYILPEAAALLDRDEAYRAVMKKSFREDLLAAFGELDVYVRDSGGDKRLSTSLGYFLKPYLTSKKGLIVDTPEAYQEALREARLFLAPLNLPRVELEASVLFVFKKLGISPSQKPRRQPGPAEAGGEAGHHRPRRRRRKGGAAAGGDEPAGGKNGTPAAGGSGKSQRADKAAAKPESKPLQKPEGKPSAKAVAKPAAKGESGRAAPKALRAKTAGTKSAAPQEKTSPAKPEAGRGPKAERQP
jgi:poly(A) polymerase